MRFFILAAATAMVSSVFATDHLVVSGNGSLAFEPSNIKAAVGDTVTFKFWPKNHSVAQSTFAKPCEPMANGFWSGYIPSMEKAATETFVYTVTNASAPIWFYCTQGMHCQGGMVGVINGPAMGNTIEKFKTNAKNVTKNVEPTIKAGSGGMLMSNGSMMSGNGSMGGAPPANANAASSLSTNVALAGSMSLFAYLLL